MNPQRPTASMTRRRWLSWSCALPASSALGGLSAAGLLSGCGGSDTAPVTLSGITFGHMAAPTAIADRATTFTNAAVSLKYSDGSTGSKTLAYKALFRTGDTLKSPKGASVLVGGYYNNTGAAIMDSSVTPAVPLFSDGPDGTSLLKLDNPTVTGVTGNVLFHVAQFEYKTANAKQGQVRGDGYMVGGTTANANALYGLLPSQIGVTTLSQDKTTGELTAVYYHNVDTSAVHGLWITCASSLSPWNTHLSSEEYPPDTAALSGSNLTNFQTFSTNLFGRATQANPYHYGHVPEVTVQPDGTATIKKHYCLGRLSREKVQVMPDNKTVLMGDDATGGGLFMFVADKAGDLSAGTLYAAKLTETDATKRSVGGAFSISFVKLGQATSAQVEALANQFFTAGGQTNAWKSIFAGVFTETTHFSRTADSTYTTALTSANGATVYLKATVTGVDSSYTLINFGSKQQLIKLNSGTDIELAAAFLETERYASYKGATMEFTKLEGLTVNIKDKKAYYAMSAIKDTMTDNGFLPAANNVLKLSKISSGGTYEVVLGTDSSIGSDWVPQSMAVPTKLLGADLSAADAYGNTADNEKIANTDNLWFSESMRTLFIGEDSGMHVNNYIWAYNVDTQTLSRIFSAPSGAECTGLQAVDNLNGFGYVMGNFQHPGDWETIHQTLVGTQYNGELNTAINTNWGNKDKVALGYMAVPAVGA